MSFDGVKDAKGARLEQLWPMVRVVDSIMDVMFGISA